MTNRLAWFVTELKICISKDDCDESFAININAAYNVACTRYCARPQFLRNNVERELSLRAKASSNAKGRCARCSDNDPFRSRDSGQDRESQWRNVKWIISHGSRSSRRALSKAWKLWKKKKTRRKRNARFASHHWISFERKIPKRFIYRVSAKSRTGIPDGDLPRLVTAGFQCSSYTIDPGNVGRKENKRPGDSNGRVGRLPLTSPVSPCGFICRRTDVCTQRHR